MVILGLFIPHNRSICRLPAKLFRSRTLRFKDFHAENFRYILKTFDISEIHDYYLGVETFEVSNVVDKTLELKLVSSSKLKT